MEICKTNIIYCIIHTKKSKWNIYWYHTWTNSKWTIFPIDEQTWCMTHLYYTLRNGPSNQTFRLLPIYVLLQSLRFCCVCIDSQTVIIVGKIYFLWWVKNVWAVYTLRRMCKNTIKTLVTLAAASRIAILSNIFPAECLPKTKGAIWMVFFLLDCNSYIVAQQLPRLRSFLLQCHWLFTFTIKAEHWK